MGAVSDYVTKLLAELLDKHGIVVWYDPQGFYRPVVDQLTLPDAKIVTCNNSFFQLRYEVDPLLNDEQPPRLLVYVPCDPADTHHALVELEAAGTVLRPGHPSLTHNTRPSVLARRVLQGMLPDKDLAAVLERLDQQQLDLAFLDALAAPHKPLSALLKSVFGSDDAEEVALRFVASDKYDAALEEKRLVQPLREMLGERFQLSVRDGVSLTMLREHFARHVLLSELYHGLKESWPSTLASVPVAQNPLARDACLRLAQAWRNQREYRDSYSAWARQVEQQYQLHRLPLPALACQHLETFPVLDKVLLQYAEQQLLEGPRRELLELAQRRLSRFWAEVEPTLQAYWALVAVAAELLLCADHIRQQLQSPPSSLAELVHAYAASDQPWCLLDTCHRHLEQRRHNLEFTAEDDYDQLHKLTTRARQEYETVGTKLAELFFDLLHKTRFPAKALLQQREIFEKVVKPHLQSGQKVAYVWVDALRFEMGRELARLLENDFQVELRPALATVPTVT
ncbi:MAG: hypothetical protein RMI91_00245 [Gemmatales bacterium]|nr:hypothetical protein [Gemmatales bacterium]MDW7993060.1 hypothetical protein [Gemmatales bacterium]